jgi:hypothetical protein
MEALTLAKIAVPGRDDSILDRLGKPIQRFNAWMNAVTSGAETLEGDGSPEGVVSAPVGKKYVDTTADDIYMKATNGGNTGWKKLN